MFTLLGDLYSISQEIDTIFITKKNFQHNLTFITLIIGYINFNRKISK